MGATDTPESLKGRVNATFRRHLPGVSQFILRTANPLQPFRTTSRAPRFQEYIVALVA
jgi:hypothetical protein